MYLQKASGLSRQIGALESLLIKSQEEIEEKIGAGFGYHK